MNHTGNVRVRCAWLSMQLAWRGRGWAATPNGCAMGASNACAVDAVRHIAREDIGILRGGLVHIAYKAVNNRDTLHIKQ